MGEERDEGERRLARRADEWEYLIDPCQQSGPFGVSGGVCVRWMVWWRLWHGREGCGGHREREMGDGLLCGAGVVIQGPGRDQGPQRGVGGKDPVVTVAVDPGWREDLGEAIQELQGREPEGGTAGGIGGGKDVEDLVGASVDEVEALQGKGGPGTVPDQRFEAGPVGGFDADAGVEAEPAAVIPGEHILGLMGFQEAVTPKMSENPGADGVLEALQELGRESGGFVEAEAGGRSVRLRFLVRINPLKEQEASAR
ncbi:MAG: hypothetical protein ABIF09_17045 [Gemmatimonadota bacterium]